MVFVFVLRPPVSVVTWVVGLRQCLVSFCFDVICITLSAKFNNSVLSALGGVVQRAHLVSWPSVVRGD